MDEAYEQLAERLSEALDANARLADEVDRLERAIKRQAAAAKQGMNAAKEHGAHMEAKARRLFAECNPEALDSERAANAQLTEENERLRSENAELRVQIKTARCA